jgi:hypothetical protein
MKATEQRFEQHRREHAVAILAPLALFDAQRHALAVDVPDLRCHHLARAQSCAVGAREHRLVLQVPNGTEPKDRRTIKKPGKLDAFNGD